MAQAELRSEATGLTGHRISVIGHVTNLDPRSPGGDDALAGVQLEPFKTTAPRPLEALPRLRCNRTVVQGGFRTAPQGGNYGWT